MTSVEILGGYRKDFIFERVRRLDRYPEFMPDVKRVKILETSLTSGASEWDIDIEGCPLHWLERDTFDNDNYIFEFRTIEGDFDVFNGRWQVLDSPRGSRVIFTVSYLVGIPVIEDIIGPILKIKIERNTQKMLDDLKKEIEASNAIQDRAFQRYRTDLVAELVAGGRKNPVRICNLSNSGAAIQLDADVTPDGELELVLPVAGDRRAMPGKVVWFCRESKQVGIMFAQPEVERVLGLPIATLASAAV